jgi:two-component system NtrC family response regulator
MAYDWPGNVRELRNVIERGIILSEDGVITVQALPRELVEQSAEGSSDAPFLSIRELEKHHIAWVLEYVEGNRSRASEMLGISRKTLYRKLKEYDLLL